jgi:Fusaric acid resistance protein-like
VSRTEPVGSPKSPATVEADAGGAQDKPSGARRILALYVLIGKRDRIRGKAIGTALGVAAAIPVAIIDPPAGVLAAVAAIAFVLALTQAKKYWFMYGLFTFSLVLFLASPGQVGFEAEERGFQILVGIGLLVVGLFIIHALGAWLADRDPQPELAPAA